MALAVLKASFAGALVASFLTALLVLVDQRLHPTNGPIDFGSPGFVLVAAGVALLAAALLSAACLGLTVAAVGVERLSDWRTLPAALVGGAAGLLVMTLLYAAIWREPPKFHWLLIGAAAGASVAAFWTRWTRS